LNGALPSLGSCALAVAATRQDQPGEHEQQELTHVCQSA